ncbi:clathrin light chain [Lipomyces arxii]|uniref:clathrin light chain n=1 Tax=Lipomyces arxii TaxID=56418 RepID=UPI0034CF9611
MSHFPSLEEIDSGQTEVRENVLEADAIDFGVPDTEDDFIAREKAILGDLDAGALQQNGHSDLINGGDADILGDEIPGVPVDDTLEYIPEPEEEEPDVVKEWRERRELAIHRRDEQSEAKKRDTRESAKQAIDDFYDNYNDKKEKAIAKTRVEEKEFIESQESTVAGGTTWERIVKLVDISDKAARTNSVDKSRFRELLLSLKNDPNAPGAKGY